MKIKFLFLATLIFFFVVQVNAQRTSDIDGSKDYPLVSRFDGSFIEYYKVVKWDEYKLPVFENDPTKLNYDNPLKLEGKIQRWQYSVSPDNNPAYVMKNFEKAFKNAGFKILLEGRPDVDFDGGSAGNFYYNYYGDWEHLNLKRFGFAYDPIGENTALIIAKTTSEGKDIYVVEMVSAFSNTTLITQDVIEVEAAETGKVSAKSLQKGIDKDGHIAVYDIFFDSGKAEVKKTSSDALGQIAAYLKENPDKKFAIVGHTDNQGDYDANMKLSQARAIAVRNILVNDYQISPDQIKAYGIGSLSPVTSNNTEAGRSQNRRVEIVEL